MLGGGPGLAVADLPAWAAAAGGFLAVDALAEAGLAVAAGRRPAAAPSGWVPTARPPAWAAEREAFLDLATRQGERLKRLVEQLLLDARVEQATASAMPADAPVEAGELVRQAAWTARLCHPDRDVRVAVAGLLPVRAAADAILAVLGNLVDNAAKYSPKDTPIRLEGAVLGDVVVLAVEDLGPGVPASDRERIFQRFIQLEAGAGNRWSVGPDHPGPGRRPSVSPAAAPSRSIPLAQGGEQR